MKFRLNVSEEFASDRRDPAREDATRRCWPGACSTLAIKRELRRKYVKEQAGWFGGTDLGGQAERRDREGGG